MSLAETIFVTGGTGVLGGRLIAELLETTRDHICCLVRCNSVANGLEKLRNAIGIYVDPATVEGSLLEGRLTVIPGEISRTRFGLDQTQYDNLVRATDRVIHCAASVDLIGSYTHLMKPNILGTKNVITFCLDADASLLHTSTYSVVGMRYFEPGFVFSENDFDVGQTFGIFPYAKTKFYAEKLVRETPGLEWAIVRPGDIYGDSVTGAYPLSDPQRQQVFYDIFKTILETGFTCFSESFFDMTPVDYVVRSMVAVMKDSSGAGQTFHLTNPTQMRFYEIVNALIDLGYRIRVVPYKTLADLFRKRKVLLEGRAYVSASANFISLLEPILCKNVNSATIDTWQTQAFLNRKSISCATLDRELLKKYIGYGVTQDYFPSPERQSEFAITVRRT